MPSVPLRALVTGFGPFPGIRENASATVAPRLAQRITQQRHGLQVVAAVLPTEWDAAPRLLARLVADIEPHLCLHLGVSSGARGVLVETIARNAAGERRDAAGLLPASDRLLEGAPALLIPRLSPLTYVSRLAVAGLPVAPSLEAGDYVCNAVYFHSLWLARRRSGGHGPRRVVTFLHLPARIGTVGEADAAEPRGVAPLSMDAAIGATLRVLCAMADLAGSDQPGNSNGECKLLQGTAVKVLGPGA